MTCPRCGADTIEAGGRHLQPAKSRVGRYLKDGTELTIDQLREGNLRGHPLHYCPAKRPTADALHQPDQGILF